jgi:hypothetical protein
MHIKEKLWVYLFISLFAYISRTDGPICTKLSMLIPWDQKENIAGSKLRRIVLSSIPGEGVSCSSETMHDRRTAPRPSGFSEELQEQTSQPRKIVLGFIPGEDGFCNSETTHDRKTATPKKCPGFDSRWRLIL